jgi:hypothetical protein
MAKHKSKKGYTHLPLSPRSPNWCAFEAIAIVAHLIRKQHAKKWQVDYLLGMLHERFIVSLPRLRRDKTKLCDTSYSNYVGFGTPGMLSYLAGKKCALVFC